MTKNFIQPLSKKMGTELQHLFNNVMLSLCQYGWYLEIVKNSSEGYCCQRKKAIKKRVSNVRL